MTENMSPDQINRYLRTLRIQALASVIKSLNADPVRDDLSLDIIYAAKVELKNLLGA